MGSILKRSKKSWDRKDEILSSNFSSRLFLLVLLLSPLTIAGNLQNAFALTPVADLTGEWSGFAQLTDTDGYCSMTGKVNAVITQTENQLSGSLSLIQTSGSSSIEGLDCTLDPITVSLSGTMDGSRITLYADEATLTGWYASSGIKLDVSASWFYGTAQLSPTGFTPPPFKPEDESTPTPPEEEDTDGDEWFDYEDACPYDPEDYAGIEDGCPEKDTDGDEWFDYEDACPYDPEDYAGIEDGCPEEEEDFAEEEEMDLTESEDLEMVLDELVLESPTAEWVMSEEETSLTETPPKFIEPPTPSVFKITEETKPFFKALWDGKCDTLSHQYQLVTGNTGQLPIVCTGGTIALPGGEMIQFSASDDFDVQLLKWGGEGLAVNYITTTIPPVGAFMNVFEAATSPIETIKALSLVIKKGEVELFGGAIKLKASCATGNCKYLKTEEEGGGFKILNVVSSYNPITKMQEAYVHHNSVYILVEYVSTETQEITSTTPEEKVTTPTKDGGGCLIATAAYGSELAPQVQQLRELRDNSLLQTASGTSFMNTFNDFYYSFSPTIADWERENPVFKEFVKISLTPMITSLSILNYVDIDSEESVLGYGISLIILNLGMYFVAPVIVIHTIRKKF